MAFFKFRWPWQPAVAGKPAKGVRALRGETVEVMRRRARHRLIGAALLVLVGVVGFPLVFDTQPRPIPVDTRIEIPDRDKVAPLVVPAPVASAPVASAPDAAVAAHQAEPAAKPTKPHDKPAALAPTHKDGGAPAFVEAKPPVASTKPETKPEPAPVAIQQAAPPAPLGEAERARALLEGRSGKVAATSPVSAVPAATPGGERFIVQVGAFSDETKVREARQKLERAGITTYTQVVQTKDGKRTRVRVGPFEGREQAEKASVKIKSLGLPAAILTL